MRNSLVLFCFSCIGLLVQAQPGIKAVKLGIGFSTFGFRGDLAEGDDAQPLASGAGFTLEVASEKTVRPQLNVGFGRITVQYRNLSPPVAGTPNTFTDTKLFYANLLLQGHILKSRRIHPIIGTGIGILSFTPRDAAGNSLVEQPQTRLEAENYGTTALMVPLTLALTGRATSRLDVQLRYQYCIVATDYLDNVSELGTKAGNDGLNHLQLLLQFRLGK
jgi:hypothetical protein